VPHTKSPKPRAGQFWRRFWYFFQPQSRHLCWLYQIVFSIFSDGYFQDLPDDVCIYIWYIHTYITLHYITLHYIYIYIYIIQYMPWSKLGWYIHIGHVHQTIGILLQPVVVCAWWDNHNRSSGPRVRMARVQGKPSSRWGEGKTMGKWENHRTTIGKWRFTLW